MSLEETLQRGYQALEKQDHHAAAEYARAALKQSPTSPGALTLLGRLAILSMRYDVALSIFEGLTKAPTPPEIWLDLARTLVGLRRDAEAVEAARAATNLAPNLPTTHLMLAEVLMSLNQRNEAADAYRRVITLDPAETRAHLGLARSLDLGAGSPEAVRMHAILGQQNIGHTRLGHLHYALSFIYKRNGDTKKFIHHLYAANNEQKLERPGSKAFYKESFDRLERAFSRDNFVKATGGASSDPAPIFIVGMPRSGTTLVEQIISAHPQVAAGGELNYARAVLAPSVEQITGQPFPLGWEGLGAQTMLSLEQPFTHLLKLIAQDKKYVTDKTPGNYHLLGLLFLLFKNRNVISVRRDPMDVAFSIFQQHFDDRSPHTYDIELLAYAYYRYERMMNLWERTFGSSIHTVRYEDLVANPEKEGKALLGAVGLDWDPNFLNFHTSKKAVHTLSMQQVRRPVNTQSVGSWRKYEAELQPLRKALVAESLIEG